MTRNEIFDKVVELLCMQLPVEAANITPETRLVEDLGADSANVMIFVCDVEGEFDIQVDNDMLARVHTVGDIVDYLETCIK